MSRKSAFVVGGAAVIAFAAGWFICGAVIKHKMQSAGGGMPAMMMAPPAVVAVQVREELLNPATEYIAKVEPVQKVFVRTEVPGYIEKVHFTEGSIVNEGDLLFTIDQSQYKAAVGVRQAELAATTAELSRAERFFKRIQEADKRSVSQVDFDNAESDLLRATAAVQQAKANLNLAQINLDYTEVRAPVKGSIGAARATRGNYVTSASGELASIIQVDPVRVTFSLTDRDYLAFRRAELSGKEKPRVAMARLPDGTFAPAEGVKDFSDNAMNPNTGTIAVRYLFGNKDGLLVPDGFVTALLRKPDSEKGILIPQRAIMMNQAGMYVLTVDAEGKVAAASILTGDQIGTRVVVLSGLKAGDKVIVDGLQKTRPGGTVSISLTEEK